ncbi:MAG: DUF2750 domain-containing protein [Marinobacter sp.]
MSDNPLAQILQMDGEERYDFFLSEVAEEREIWILVNAGSQFLKIVSEEDDVAYLPVWPGAELAAEYAKGAGDLSPKSLSLPDFFRKWVPGLSRDGLEIGVFPVAGSDLWITGPEELKRDLQEVMSAF